VPPALPQAVPQARAVSLSGYVSVAASVGLDPYQMLAEAGIEPRLLDDPEARLPAAAIARLLERSAARSGCETFALRLVEERSFASLGPLSVMLRYEDNLRDMIAAMRAYGRLMSDVQIIELKEAEGEAELRVDIALEGAGRQIAELVAGLTRRFLAEAMFGGWHPEAAHFRHGPPADMAVHQRVFRTALRFGSHFNGFSFPAALLDRENAFADAGLRAHARDHLDRLCRELPELALADQVRAAIRAQLADGGATLPKVAAGLRLHPRALQRRLAAHGAPFAAIVEETRDALARELLADTDLPVADVAARAGYASATSFTRWFAARAGLPPGEWRAKARG
jgi:AraC-like DNA-binding protein